jgi:putative membrane protein
MYRLTGFALTALAAGLFAAGPALAQTGSGGQSGSGQSDRSGSQSGSMSGQSGRSGSGSQAGHSGSGQSDRSGSMSGQSGTSRSGSDPSASAGGSQSSQLASSEQKFLQKAAKGSMAEIELGKLAQERGQSDDVKELGQKLVQDHTKALEEVRQIAQSKNVTLDEELDSKYRKTQDRLSKLSGEEFDRAFLKEIHREHQRDIADFRKQSQNAKDDQVKDFAARTLPALEQHQQMAMQHMGGSSSPRTDDDTSGARSGSGASGTSGRDRSGSGMSGSSGSGTGTSGTGSSGSGSSGSSGGGTTNPR